jgi:hypothetical protein
MTAGSKTEKALHALLFHPEEGFLAWILHLRERFDLKPELNVHGMANWFRNNWNTFRDSLSVPTDR